MLSSTVPHDRQVGLCVFDDIVEFGGAAALIYFEQFVPTMLQLIADAHPGVRQAAAYGVGVCAEKACETFRPLIPDALNRLSVMVQDIEARSDDNVHATENAISAIGKVCRYQSNAIDVTQVLPHWLSLLPVTHDKVESKIVYDSLCFFLENANFSQVLIGSSYQNLPRILSIFGEVLGSALIDEAISARITNILKHMQTAFPGNILQQAYVGLSNEQKARLHQCLSVK